MPYTSVPNTGETLGGTRDEIRENFNIINTSQSVNHVAFDASGQGKHKFLQMPDQSAAPATAINEGGFYTKNSGGTNLFFRSESSGSEYKLTAVDDSEFAEFATNTQYETLPQNSNGGWTFLPGGLLLMYGTAVMASGNGTVRYPKSFSAAPYSIQLQMQKDTTTVDVFLLKVTQAANELYVRNTDSNSRSLNWMAIGPA